MAVDFPLLICGLLGADTALSPFADHAMLRYTPHADTRRAHCRCLQRI
jgi:hypothetical protein